MANGTERLPEQREYVFQLHRSGRPWNKRPDEVDWNATAVGRPERFVAVQFGVSAWYARGPVTVTAPEAIEAPAWTVRATDETTPTMSGEVGHRLGAGERFDLPVTGMLVGAIPRRGDAPHPGARSREN